MISKFSVKKPVTIVMITLIVMIFGGISFTNLSTDLFPSINIPIAAVSTVYFGASPEEIESLVTQPLEAQLARVNRVESMSSTSSEHSSIIIVSFSDGTNMDSAIIDLRDRLNMVTRSLPEGASEPTVIRFDPNMMPIMAFAVTQEGKTMSEVTYFTDNVLTPRLESIEGVASVSRSGGSNEEIVITLDSERLGVLSQYGFNKDRIASLLTAQNLNLPAGTITEDNIDYSVRVVGKFEDIKDIEDLVLLEMTLPEMMHPVTGEPLDFFETLSMMQIDMGTEVGTEVYPDMEVEIPTQMPSMPEMVTHQLRMADIASIEFVERGSADYARVNGEESISISIQKQNNIGTTDVVALIHESLDSIQLDYPGTEVLITLDQAEYINEMVSSVVLNAIIGGILAVLILLIFLKDLRPTIIIGVAIPISIVAAFTAIWLSEITLNVVSLGGLALGIGMLVDNAVVVLENIYRLRKEGLSRTDAAIEGSKQVSGAIIASTLTTIAVFMPVLFVEGFAAEIFQEMAIVVGITLAASLIIALSLVPMMSSKLIKKPDMSTHHGMMDATKRFYVRVLKRALRHRVMVLMITILLFVSSIFGVMRIGMEFMPGSDEGQIRIAVNMPKGTTYRETVQEVQKVEGLLTQVEAIEVISASVSSGGGGGMMMMGSGSSDSGSVSVILKPVSERSQSTKEVADIIRELLFNRTLAEEILVSETSANIGSMMGGTPVQVQITGPAIEVLEGLAESVANIMADVEGTTEIDNGIQKGAPEININLRPDQALAKGVLVPTVSGMINENMSGTKATSIIYEGREIGIYLTESNQEAWSMSDIQEMLIEGMTGESVLLADVADIETGFGYTSISRTNQRRVLTVGAELLDGYDPGTVGQAVERQIRNLDIPDGYEVTMAGEFEEIMDAFSSLLLALILGVVIVYMIMASQFESFKYPFIILFTIPLAFTGGLLGLFITRTPLSIVSVLGFIVLAGIVVNNGIVLVDYINQLKASGKTTKDAIMEAAPTRLRPILMTALTTILALLPSAIGFGDGAEMIQPLGISVVGGLMMSTFLTLVVVPVLYDLFDGKKQRPEVI